MTYKPGTTMHAERHIQQLRRRNSEIEAIRDGRTERTVWNSINFDDEYHKESIKVIEGLIERIRAEGGE